MDKPDGRRKPGMREDSPEQIAQCLSCERNRCTNCLDPKTKGNNKFRQVIAYREDDDDMLFDSALEAGEFFFCSAQVIYSAIRHGKMTQGYYWRYA